MENWGVHPFLKSFSSLHGHLNLNEGTKLSNTNGQFKQIRNNNKLIKSKCNVEIHILLISDVKS